MAALLRRIVAGPRAEHPETGLDLCYVTSNIIATSGPSQSYPQLAYRNPLDRLVSFLDTKHGEDWAIWEFRAEGTGYPDEAVYGRIRHYPWPDHHPPPFRLVPMILASMRQWLEETPGPDPNRDPDRDPDTTNPKRVAVVHCKAGKGRSGTMACSYLIAECGWSSEKALARFTERRMRPGFGNGITIPSQLRYIGYVERWARHGNKRYVDQPVEIVEIHVWGLRHGVKLVVEGYVDEGKRIHAFHTFRGNERLIIEGDAPGGSGFLAMVSDMAGKRSGSAARDDKQKAKRANTDDILAANVSGALPKTEKAEATDEMDSDGQCRPSPATRNSSPTLVSLPNPTITMLSERGRQQSSRFASRDEPGGQAVVFRPDKPIRLPNSDVNIDIERRNKTTPNIVGLTMVTSVAHVWFNTYFEGGGPENEHGRADDSGVFTINWEELDGIKGSSQKGSRAADRLAVVWRVPKEEVEREEKAEAEKVDQAEQAEQKEETVPGDGKMARDQEDGNKLEHGEVPQMRPADWRGSGVQDPDAGKHLGLRIQDPDSAAVSKASSIRAEEDSSTEDVLQGVQAIRPEDDTEVKAADHQAH